MLDLLIKGGTVIDGTGRDRFRADVGVRDGRIVAIGDITESAAKTIDAEGRVVTPGFVDLHTHYDPQVMWDPAATPSSLHGVTSVFGGNCGFSIAPVTPEAAEYLIPMLARVEGMPIESLEAGLDLMWDGFGSWLDRLEGNLAVNAGFMVGHSALRRVVMGEDAVGYEATPGQIAAMVALLHRSIEEGGMGFSSTASNSHSDHQGNPVPSRWATRDEFIALSAATGQHAGTSLEFIASAAGTFTEDEMNLMADMSVAAQRSLNWNVMVVSSDPTAAAGRENKLSASDVASAKGGRVVGLCLPEPMRMRLCFASGFVLDILPGVSDVIHLPLPERKAALADPAVRASIAAALSQMPPQHSLAAIADYRIIDVSKDELQQYVGRVVADIAIEKGVAPIDALHDIGKATTTKKEDKDNRWHAYGHEEESFHLAPRFLAQITNEKKLIDSILPLVRWHGQPYYLHKAGAGDAAVRRLANKVVRIDRLCRVDLADRRGRGTASMHGPSPHGEWLAERAAALQVASTAPKKIVLGRHLIAMGHKPAGWFSQILDEAFEAQLDGVFGDEAGGLAWLAERMAKGVV